MKKPILSQVSILDFFKFTKAEDPLSLTLSIEKSGSPKFENFM